MKRSEAKLALIEERRLFRRKVRRCFWSWPFGHRREYAGPTFGGKEAMRCVECGDEIYR